MRMIDITGQRFGRLLVLERVGLSKSRSARWLCRCDCGTEKEVDGPNLRRGLTTSCGCYGHYIIGAATRTHGRTGSKVHYAWCSMRRRCEDEGNPKYPIYGGRGIKVCDQWQSFENFYADMGEPPSPAHSIDRIDVNGNYEPDNCRWATAKEQANNQRPNHKITYNGETHGITEWSRRLGIHHVTLVNRIQRGWPLERAMAGPTRRRRSLKQPHPARAA